MNNKIKVLIGDDSAESGVSVANKLRERGLYAYTRRKDCNVIFESIKMILLILRFLIFQLRMVMQYPL